MQRVLHLALKDLKLISRDRVGMFFMLAFPVIMGIFFGFVMGKAGDSDSAGLTIAVVDEDDSDMSKRLTDSLESSGNVSIERTDRQTAQDLVRRGRMVGMIALPSGFGETAGILWAEPPTVEIAVDPSRSAEAAMMEGMLMQAMGELISARFQDSAAMRTFVRQQKEQLESDASLSPQMRLLLTAMFSSIDSVMESVDNVNQAQDPDAPAGPMAGGLQLADIRRIDVTRQIRPGSQADLMQKIRSRWDISFPQSMVWGILGCVAGFATLLVRERSMGTLTRLHVAPIPRWQILAGKGVGCFLAVTGVILFMMLIGYALGMRPGNWPLLLLATVCSAWCFTGIMMLISMMGRTEQAVSGAGWGACVVMAMFGGGMLPAAFMPGFMKTISEFDPVKWCVVSVEGAIWRQFSPAEMMVPCGLLLAFGAAAIALGSFLISRREM